MLISVAASADLAIVVENLSFASEIESEWLEILIRVCGDIPELWNPKKPSVLMEDETDMAMHSSGGDSLQAPQTAPSTTLDSHGSSHHTALREANPPYRGNPSAGPFVGQLGSNFPPASAYDNHGSFRQSRRLPHPSLSQPGQAVRGGHFGSSYSLPHPPLSDSTFAVHHGNDVASQSLPNLPSEVNNWSMDTSGLGEDWSGFDVVFMGHYGHVPGPSSIQHQNFQHSPHFSIPTVPSNTPLSSAPAHDASSVAMTGHNVPQAFGNVPRAFGGTSHRSHTSASTQSRTSGARDAVDLERARGATLATRNSLLRTRGSRLNEYSHLILTSVRLYYDSMHRVLCSDYLRMPLPDGHRRALLQAPHHIGQLMVCVYLDWKRDMET